jgi:hypothetical protein
MARGGVAPAGSSASAIALQPGEQPGVDEQRRAGVGAAHRLPGSHLHGALAARRRRAAGVERA